MSFLTVEWASPTTIGLQPRTPGDGEDPRFTVAWGPRLSTVWIDYDEADLRVAPGAGPDPVVDPPPPPPVDPPPGDPPPSDPPPAGDPPVVVQPDPGPTTSSGSGTPATVPAGGPAVTADAGAGAPAGPAGPISPQLRPHTLVVAVAPRKEPRFLRRMGLGVTLVLDAPGTVTVVLVRPARRGVMRAKVTRTTTKRLPAGRTRLRLRLSDTGRLLTRRRLTVARLEVGVRYDDGTRSDVTRPVRIART